MEIPQREKQPEHILYNENGNLPNKETEDILLKKREEIYKLFDNNVQRLRDMGNTLICPTEDDNQEELIWDILKTFAPNRLRAIMADEPGVAYSPFNGLPHLLLPIVSDPSKMEGALSWLHSENVDRFRKFVETKTKSIDQYNDKVYSLKNESIEPLPYILFIVHEIALSNIINNDAFNLLLLNGGRAGIYFLLFSRYSSKHIPFGRELELLSLKTISETRMFFQPSNSFNRDAVEYSDSMTGIESEHFCCDLLEKNGFH